MLDNNSTPTMYLVCLCRTKTAHPQDVLCGCLPRYLKVARSAFWLTASTNAVVEGSAVRFLTDSLHKVNSCKIAPNVSSAWFYDIRLSAKTDGAVRVFFKIARCLLWAQTIVTKSKTLPEHISSVHGARKRDPITLASVCEQHQHDAHGGGGKASMGWKSSHSNSSEFA